MAQTAAPAVVQLEEITVTAQRHEESLSKTPVAVAVVSAEELTKNQVISEQDLRFAAPGLTVRATLNSNQLGFALRGQSQDAYSNARPGVLPYFNEVQISATGQGAGSTALYDLQSVQVLKGPQGTLFGRSATGGAVLYTTAKPTDHLVGYISALGGNFGAQKMEGAISGPLAGDLLQGRLSVYYQKRDGFQRNLFTNRTNGDVKRTGGRLSLTANFTDSVRNEFVGDYLDTRGQNTTGVISGLTPFSGSAQGPFIPLQFLYSGTSNPTAIAIGEGTLAAFVPPAFAPLVPGFYQNYFADPRHPTIGLTAFLAAQQALGPYVVNTDTPNAYNAKDTTVSNTTTFTLNEHMLFKNIFGYVKKSSFNSNDGDGTPYTIVAGTAYNIDTRGVSDEIQLQGKTAGEKLTYVTGLYYSDETETQDLDTSFFDLIFGGQSQTNAFDITHKTIAPYGQGTYQLNDRGLAFTLGARYTSEKVGTAQLPIDSTVIFNAGKVPANQAYNQSTTYSNVNWHVGLQEQLNPNWLVYGASRRAYKSGGYNGTIPPVVGYGATGGNAFKEERLTDIELGSKFQGIWGGVPVRMNVALYHIWDVDSAHRDFTLVGTSPSGLTINVPSAKVYGGEFDLQFKPTRHLTAGITLSYTHAQFGGEPVVVFGVPAAFDQVPDTPKTVSSAFAEFIVPLRADYELSIHGDLYYQSESNAETRSFNNFGTVVPAYNIGNCRIGLENTRAHWSLQANVKNVSDKVYYVGALPTGVIYQVNTRIPGEPRTFTLEARYKY